MSAIEQVVNIQTGEVVEKPYSADQLKELEIGQQEANQRIADFAAYEAKKVAIIEKLGLTEQEAALLF